VYLRIVTPYLYHSLRGTILTNPNSQTENKMNTVNITSDNFLPALLAPFGGKDTHNAEGEALPSSTSKAWTFTLHNTERDTHLTFKARRPRGWTVESPVLIDLMVGKDNSSDFGFLGSVSPRGFYKASPKSKVDADRKVVADRTLVWLLTKLNNGVDLPEALEIKGASKCCRCAKKLTNPDSVDDGMGPVCRKKASSSKVSRGV